MNNDLIFAINKPAGYTSFDVVRQIKKKFKIKKVGHTGTLDPFATGVLIVCCGNNTKIISYLLNQDKTYEAEITLGMKSETFDITGNEIDYIKIPEISKNKKLITEKILSFKENYFQTPPQYSAKKYKGKSIYKYAREGKFIELKPVKVDVKNIIINNINILEKTIVIKLIIEVSKGTYIRSFAHDLGVKLNTEGILSSLKRIKAGNIEINQCTDLKDINSEKSLPIEDFLNYKVIVIKDKAIMKFLNGTAIAFTMVYLNNINLEDNEIIIVKNKFDMVLGLAKVKLKPALHYAPVKVFIRNENN